MSVPRYMKIEAVRFVAMLRAYAFYKSYKAGWIKKMYEARCPTQPLTQEEFDNSGTAKPTEEFKAWIRTQHARAYKAHEFIPSPRFKANSPGWFPRKSAHSRSK